MQAAHVCDRPTPGRSFSHAGRGPLALPWYLAHRREAAEHSRWAARRLPRWQRCSASPAPQQGVLERRPRRLREQRADEAAAPMAGEGRRVRTRCGDALVPESGAPLRRRAVRLLGLRMHAPRAGPCGADVAKARARLFQLSARGLHPALAPPWGNGGWAGIAVSFQTPRGCTRQRGSKESGPHQVGCDPGRVDFRDVQGFRAPQLRRVAGSAAQLPSPPARIGCREG